MKTVNANELRNVEGGATTTCHYCGTRFKDTVIKFLWWKIVLKTGQQKWAQHLRGLGTTCMYA